MSPALPDLKIPEKATPIVEIDTEAAAAYIRVSNESVTETQLIRDDDIVVTVDLDFKREVVGIEVVGTTEYTLDRLLEYSGIPVFAFSKSQWLTRYVRAGAF